MNCENPTLAIRKAGINQATGRFYKPHTFIRFSTPEKFVEDYFHFKKFERSVSSLRLVNQPVLFGDETEPRFERVYGPDQEVIILPCNRPGCILCTQAKRRVWACRCINEAQMSGGGVFLTLTCSDDSQLRTFPGNSLTHRPFQLFMKRLKKSNRLISLKTGRPTSDCRFFMCGEYGERAGRAHYHAILFGVDFPDRKWIGRSHSGGDLYNSPLLDELRYDRDGTEIFGPISNFADASPYDISYTCGYVDKKLVNNDPTYYVRNGVAPEYVKMSRRPGIGAAWLDRFHGDVWKFYQSQVIDTGVRATPDFKYQVPRYYFDRAIIRGLLSTEECDIIQSDRRGRVSEISADPGLMLESLKRAQDRAAIKRHELDVFKVHRQF